MGGGGCHQGLVSMAVGTSGRTHLLGVLDIVYNACPKPQGPSSLNKVRGDSGPSAPKCSWRRQLASRHLLQPFPSLSLNEGPPNCCSGPPFLFLHRWWVAQSFAWGGGGGLAQGLGGWLCQPVAVPIGLSPLNLLL